MTIDLSYWEAKTYLQPFDLIVVGAGIVGLSTAISFRELHPKARILILERGILPSGASTKNAGFACFGSAGEILDDLQHQDPETVFETITMRFNGLALLRRRLGDKVLAFEMLGGFEIFESAQKFEMVQQALPGLNDRLAGLTGPTCFQVAKGHQFGLGPHSGMIRNNFEGQLDSACMMQALQKMVHFHEIELLTGVEVKNIDGQVAGVKLQTNLGELTCSRCVVATNAFASQLLPLNEVLPGRAQVLVTKPISGLKLRGSFHFDRGYYYFRNIDDRILFGGGRNLNPEREETFINGITEDIQTRLENLLTSLILPDQQVEIERRWSGIMGLGKEKMPIIKEVQNRVIAAVRMGGMGVAIGSLVGEIAAKQVSQY